VSVPIGAGWRLTHLTDRTVELVKECPVYRRFCGGRDGRVLVRAEPGMDRTALIEKAIRVGLANDERLALRVGTQMLPSKAALARYQGKQLRMERVFGVPGEEPAERIYRP
jgi:hypothetical protein